MGLVLTPKEQTFLEQKEAFQAKALAMLGVGGLEDFAPTQQSDFRCFCRQCLLRTTAR